MDSLQSVPFSETGQRERETKITRVKGIEATPGRRLPLQCSNSQSHLLKMME